MRLWLQISFSRDSLKPEEVYSGGGDFALCLKQIVLPTSGVLVLVCALSSVTRSPTDSSSCCPHFCRGHNQLLPLPPQSSKLQHLTKLSSYCILQNNYGCIYLFMYLFVCLLLNARNVPTLRCLSCLHIHMKIYIYIFISICIHIHTYTCPSPFTPGALVSAASPIVE